MTDRAEGGDLYQGVQVNQAADDLRPGLSRVYRRGGKYAHLSSNGNFGPDHSSKWADGQWLGTGSQQEYDQAASKPLCPACKRRWGLTGLSERKR